MNKKPATRHGLNDAVKNADYQSWIRQGFNVGIAMRQSNLIAIDVDIAKGKQGFKDLAELKAIYGELPATLTQRSARGGRHIIFKNIGVAENTVNQLTDSIDIRDKAYILVQPSIYNGGKYEFIDGIDEYGNITLAELPQSWLNIINKSSAKRVNNKTFKHAINTHKRNNLLNLDINKVINECNFLCYCRDNPRILLEKQWFSMISVLAHIKDSDSVIHALSIPYDRYTYEETQYKIERARNFGYPQTCKYISENFPEICGNCTSKKCRKE